MPLSRPLADSPTMIYETSSTANARGRFTQTGCGKRVVFARVPRGNRFCYKSGHVEYTWRDTELCQNPHIATLHTLISFTHFWYKRRQNLGARGGKSKPPGTSSSSAPMALLGTCIIQPRSPRWQTNIRYHIHKHYWITVRPLPRSKSRCLTFISGSESSLAVVGSASNTCSLSNPMGPLFLLSSQATL